MAIDGYWGLCPTCKKTDGCVNMGSNHWFICKKHRSRWYIGTNLFSSWLYETKSEQLRHCKEIGLDTFRDVEPFYPEIEGVQRVSNGEADEKEPAVLRKKSDKLRLVQVGATHVRRGKK